MYNLAYHRMLCHMTNVQPCLPPNAVSHDQCTTCLPKMLCHMTSVQPCLPKMLCHMTNVQPSLPKMLCHMTNVQPCLPKMLCHVTNVQPSLSRDACKMLHFVKKVVIIYKAVELYSFKHFVVTLILNVCVFSVKEAIEEDEHCSDWVPTWPPCWCNG